MSQHFRLLNEAQVKALLPMDDLIQAMEDALARFSAGDVLQPVRTVLTVGPTKAFFGVMPAYMPRPARLGAKLVTVFGQNESRGLPSHLATILLLDPDTGALVALLDGRYITEARTAAVSAVSARHLARADAATLAIIGTGVQARSHLEALKEFSLGERVVATPGVTRASWARWRRSCGRLRAVERAEGRPRRRHNRAGHLVPTPVIDDAWVSPGAHVISVGACRPDQREMDPVLVTRARIYVDSRAAALVESATWCWACEGRFTRRICGELGQVVLGRAPGRSSDQDVTVFKSLGMAVEDVVAADLALRKAVENSSGVELTL
jgi:ornithine cyclodeaminase/alanine dehydrogenase-like protein (mu-crystallin family)